jgi:hypothetical protein
VKDRWTDRQTDRTKTICLPTKVGGDIILFNNAIKCIKVLLKTVYCSFKISSIFCLLNILNSYCAYYQEILWELCLFELRNFSKFTTEAACQHNSSETTEQNFMNLGR